MDSTSTFNTSLYNANYMSKDTADITVNLEELQLSPSLRNFHSQLNQLCNAQSRDGVNVEDFAHQFQYLVDETWKACSELNSSDQLHCFPRFSTDRLNNIFQKLCQWAALLELLCRGMLPKALRHEMSHFNMLLVGSRGVGKTTLMEGFHNVLRVLSRHICPIYIDYEQGELTAPTTLARKALGVDENDPKLQSVRELVRHGLTQDKCLFFFCDEIPVLYAAPGEEQVRERGLKIVKELLSIGKFANLGCVISGSSVFTKALAFRQDLEGRQLDERAKSYVNLNNTVYIPDTLTPLRSAEEVQGVFEDAKTRYLTSGGVGRLLKSKTGHLELHKLHEYLNEPAFAALACVLVHENGLLRCTGTEINLDAQMEEKIVGDPWILKGVTRVRAIEVINEHRKNEGVIMLDRWRDEGVLYEDEDNAMVEFLRPVDALAFAKLLCQKKPIDHMTFTAYMLTFQGPSNGGSAGAMLEMNTISMAVSAESLDGATSLLNPLRVYNLDKFDPVCENSLFPHNEVFKLKADIGADGIWIFDVDEGKRTGSVGMVQVKLGKKGTKIKLGGNAAWNSSHTNLTLKTIAAKMVDTVWPTLKTNLESRAGWNLTLQSLVLITNKIVNDSDVSALNNLEQLTSKGLSLKVYESTVFSEFIPDNFFERLRHLI
eukprot:Rmarinus@m.24738